MAKKKPFTILDPKKRSKDVTFRAPAGSTGIAAKVLDRIWSNEETGSWGTYLFFAELLELSDGDRRIRLGYYRKPGEELIGGSLARTRSQPNQEP